MCRISVILPTFNRAHTMERALESVWRQSYRNFELIVVDDGSVDSTPELLRGWEARWSGHRSGVPFRVLRQENRGVSAARNLGVSHARGELLAFLDSDDEWLAGKLEAQAAEMEVASHPWSQTGEIWVRNGRRVNPPRHSVKAAGDLFAASLERCMVTPSSVILRRTLFEREGGFDESLPACEDYDLWLRIGRAHPIGLLPKAYLIRYGGHADQLSATVPALDRYRIQSLNGLLRDGRLLPEQQSMAMSVLAKKLSIYAQGASKRGYGEELEWCRAIAQKHRIQPPA